MGLWKLFGSERPSRRGTCRMEGRVVLNEENGMKSPRAVNLHNAVTVSQQHLGDM